MVVAGAEVDVAPQSSPLPAHHQNHLAVRLVAGNAVDDMRARLLQTIGQFDIGRLVEPRPEFDHHHHFLAGPGGLYQAVHQRRVRAGPVQRLLDGEHVGIDSGTVEEVHDRREGLVGMVQQDVALGDGVEYVRGLDQYLGDARGEGGILQLRRVDEVVHRQQALEVDRAVHLVQVFAAQLEVFQQVLREFVGAIVRRLKAHRSAVPALEQLPFQRPDQVVDLLVVQIEVAVAGDPELVTAVDGQPGKELVGEVMNDGRQKYEIRSTGAGQVRGEPNEPRQRPGRLNDGAMPLAAEGVLSVQADDEVEALVENARYRARGIEGRWAEHRHHFGVKVVLEPTALFVAPFVPPNEPNAGPGKLRNEIAVQYPVLFGDQLIRLVRQDPQHFRRRHGLRADGRRADRQALFQARDANLEKLVQVGGGDAQELEPFQQRDRLVPGLL